MRVTEVWMDEYKEYFYIREPYTRELDYGITLFFFLFLHSKL